MTKDIIVLTWLIAMTYGSVEIALYIANIKETKEKIEKYYNQRGCEYESSKFSWKNN